MPQTPTSPGPAPRWLSGAPKPLESTFHRKISYFRSGVTSLDEGFLSYLDNKLKLFYHVKMVFRLAVPIQGTPGLASVWQESRMPAEGHASDTGTTPHASYEKGACGWKETLRQRLFKTRDGWASLQLSRGETRGESFFTRDSGRKGLLRADGTEILGLQPGLTGRRPVTP